MLKFYLKYLVADEGPGSLITLPKVAEMYEALGLLLRELGMFEQVILLKVYLTTLKLILSSGPKTSGKKFRAPRGSVRPRSYINWKVKEIVICKLYLIVAFRIDLCNNWEY